jgi:alanyl-tRNA synthetase
LKQVEKADISKVDGKFVFDLYQNQGFPFEVSYEIFKLKGVEISQKDFLAEFEKHRNISK